MKKTLTFLFAAAMAASASAFADDAACSLPGVLVSSGTAPASLAGAPDPTPGHTAQAVYFAEPPAGADGVLKLVVTLKVDTLSPTAPPNTVYYVYFNLDDGLQHFLAYDPSPTAMQDPTGTGLVSPPFTYGHLETGPGGVGNLVTDGAADADSNAKADGSIEWVLTKTKIAAIFNSQFAAGAYGDVRVLIGAAGTGLVTSVDSTNPGDYQFTGNKCGGGKSGLLGLGALPLPGLLLLASLAALRRRV